MESRKSGMKFSLAVLMMSLCLFAQQGLTKEKTSIKKTPDYQCSKLERSICQETFQPPKNKKSTSEGVSEDLLQRVFAQAKHDLIATLRVENPPWKERAVTAVQDTSLVQIEDRKKFEKREDYKMWCGKDGKSPNLYWSLRENQVMLCGSIYEWISEVGEKTATPSLYHRFVHELVHTFGSADDPNTLELFCDEWANKTLSYKLLTIRSKAERWLYLASSVQRFCVSNPSTTHPPGNVRLKKVIEERRILKILGCVKK